MTAAPIIVTALFGDEDFHWLDRQRREFYPPERNQLRAHLTMFSHLPPSCEAELCQRLRSETLGKPPRARTDGLMSLDTGVAYRIDSPELENIRANLAEPFERMLTPQDSSPWYLHVTIQNKVKPAVAKALMAFDLANLAEVPAAYLSAGQRRRLGLARLLSAERPIWLLDEPTVSLDEDSRHRFAELVRSHLAFGGIAIAATHADLGLTSAKTLRLSATRKAAA